MWVLKKLWQIVRTCLSDRNLISLFVPIILSPSLPPFHFSFPKYSRTKSIEMRENPFTVNEWMKVIKEQFQFWHNISNIWEISIFLNWATSIFFYFSPKSSHYQNFTRKFWKLKWKRQEKNDKISLKNAKKIKTLKLFSQRMTIFGEKHKFMRDLRDMMNIGYEMTGDFHN